MLSAISRKTMNATTVIGLDTEISTLDFSRSSERRASSSVTAGMSDVEFEAWLVAQGGVRMSEQRRAELPGAMVSSEH